MRVESLAPKTKRLKPIGCMSAVTSLKVRMRVASTDFNNEAKPSSSHKKEGDDENKPKQQGKPL